MEWFICPPESDGLMLTTSSASLGIPGRLLQSPVSYPVFDPKRIPAMNTGTVCGVFLNFQSCLIAKNAHPED